MNNRIQAGDLLVATSTAQENQLDAFLIERDRTGSYEVLHAVFEIRDDGGLSIHEDSVDHCDLRIKRFDSGFSVSGEPKWNDRTHYEAVDPEELPGIEGAVVEKFQTLLERLVSDQQTRVGVLEESRRRWRESEDLAREQITAAGEQIVDERGHLDWLQKRLEAVKSRATETTSTPRSSPSSQGAQPDT